MLETFLIALIPAVVFLVVVKVVTNRVTSRYFNIISQLIKMNEVDGFDPVKLLTHLEPFLKKLKINDFGYYLFYHNVEYVRRNNSSKKSMAKFVYTSEYSVYIEIVPAFGHLESDLTSKMLVEIIFLLLKADVNVQTTAVQKAFRKSEEIQTFVNHDIKNMIQFVNVLEFNVSQVDDDAGYKRLVRYIKKSLPGLKVKADKILSALNSTMPETGNLPEKVYPIMISSDIASVYGFSIYSSTRSDFEITAKKISITVIIENIIKNFYDKSINQKGIDLYIDAHEENSCYIITFRDTGAEIPDCEKIFEPFYSDKVNGLGIGLFHCRNVAAGMQGTLTAANSAQGPVFTLTIKK